MNAETKVKAATTLHGAMALAFAEIEAATKTANNPHFKSKYADLGAVIDAIKPALVKHGLFYTQHPQPSNGGVTVETLLHHVSGETLPMGALFVPADKSNPQAYGSALTYARRYGLVTAFGVPTEDDDGNAASAKSTATITADQLSVLQTYASGGVIDAQRFCSFFQIDSLKELPADRYDEAVRMAQAKAAKAREVEPVQ